VLQGLSVRRGMPSSPKSSSSSTESVVLQLVSVAFTRLADAITTLSSPSASLEAVTVARTTIRCASRLLDTLLQSVTATSRTDSADKLLKAVKAAFVADSIPRLDADEAQDLMLDLAHLVGVALKCTRKPADKTTAEMYRDCVAPLARQAAVRFSLFLPLWCTS